MNRAVLRRVVIGCFAATSGIWVLNAGMAMGQHHTGRAVVDFGLAATYAGIAYLWTRIPFGQRPPARDGVG